jgi:signal transduction histidine kinase
MTEQTWLRYFHRISGQIALVVVSSIVLALALAVTIIVMTRPGPDLHARARAKLDVFLSVVRLIDAAPDQNVRAEILKSAAIAFPDLRIATIPTAEIPQDGGRNANDGSGADEYVAVLRRMLGSRFSVIRVPHLAGRNDGTVVKITSTNGVALRATVPRRPPPERRLTPIVGGAVLTVLVSVVLLLLWATKALTAPLSRFADAAEQFGRDFEHRTLPDRGPEEIRKASRAFNQMGARIKRLIEDRTNMLAAISHDLRTPITRLRLRTEFVEDETLRNDMLNDLEQLTEMVKSTLAFLRDSRLDEAMTNFDLAELLRKICGQFAEIGKEVTYAGDEQKVVSGRPDAISRAVTNLIENAVKFGTKASVVLHSLADGSVAIDVLDDGPGISDPDPVRLLRPFVRGDSARTLTPQSGFGLGLTIANSIIEAHGGQLTLTNRKPCGLAARLRLAGNRQSRVDSTGPAPAQAG